MVLRIGGLASGIDTDQIVKDLMKAHRIPLDKLYQQKQLLEWKWDAYREINAKILSFRNNKLFNFKLENTLAAKKAVLSGNTGALSAKATANAQQGTMTIQVNKLAVAATKLGTGDIRADSTFDPNATLKSQEGKLGIGTFSQTSYTFQINGTAITVDVTQDSLNDVIQKINNQTNVTAFYDEVTGRVSFMAKNTGKVNGATGDQAYISFEEDTAGGHDFLSNALKMNISDPTANATAGEDAELVINGLTTTRTSNQFTINGVEITLLQAGGAATTIGITADTDKIVEAIKGFIEDYNDILSTLQSKVSENRYRDYLPLTDGQKEEMTEKQIELWEEKAKSGLLRNDTILVKAINQMRLDISGVVDTGNTKYSTLSSIGIETGSYLERGKLYLADEAKLRAAIEEDPEAVLALFTADGNGDSDRSDVGIAERLYEDLKNVLTELSARAGTSPTVDSDFLNPNSYMAKELDRVEERIDVMTVRLAELENRYYRQFTMMEQAISRYNAQAAYLLQQFGN